jgi:hypothetical protein
VAVQRQPNSREDLLIIPGRTTKVPKKTGIRGNSEPTFAQHGKIAEHSDCVQVQVD